MFNEPKVEPPKTLWPQCIAGLTATIGGLILGSCIGWSGPAIPMLLNSTTTDFSVTKTECNFVASLMPGGALFGGGYLYYLDKKALFSSVKGDCKVQIRAGPGPMNFRAE